MNVERVLEAGVENLQAGRLRDAAAAFLEVLGPFPRHPEANHLLAQTALLAGDLDEAAWRASLAAQLDPQRADFHLLAGNVAQRRGEPARAEAFYRDALRLEPAFAEARLNLGNVLDELGRTDEALAAYDEALALQPDLLPAALNRAALLQRAGRADQANRELAQLEARFPESAELLYRKAWSARSAGDEEAALRGFRAVLEREPAHARAHYELGALLAARGDASAALGHFERCLRAQPGLREAQLWHARLLLKVGRTGEAWHALAALRARHLDWAPAQFAYADACVRARRDEEAIAAYDAGLLLEPGNAGARESRAQLVARRAEGSG
jgi:tetratricopeptide (TPR) repeat protein